MPRCQRQTKDVASCDKPRGAASKLRSGDFWTGEPDIPEECHPKRRIHSHEEWNSGNWTISVPEGKESKNDSHSSGERIGRSLNQARCQSLTALPVWCRGIACRGLSGSRRAIRAALAEVSWKAALQNVKVMYIHVFECRSERRSVFRMNPFGNMKLVGAVIISVAVLAAAVMIPQLQLVFSTVTPNMVQFLAALGFSFAVPVLTNLFHNS